MEIQIEYQGKIHNVIISENKDRFSVIVDEKKFDIDLIEYEKNSFSMLLDNKIINFFADIKNGDIKVLINNIESRLKIVDQLENFRKKRRYFSADGKIELKANMPGKIVKILKEEGDRIKENDSLMIIEAMKMENELKSPKQGSLMKIGVSEGESVETGTLLAVIE